MCENSGQPLFQLKSIGKHQLIFMQQHCIMAVKKEARVHYEPKNHDKKICYLFLRAPYCKGHVKDDTNNIKNGSGKSGFLI